MKALRARVLIPLTIPLAAVGIVIIIVFNISRVLIALEENASAAWATTVAIVGGSAVLGAGALISYRHEARRAGKTVLATGAALIVGAGLVGVGATGNEEHEVAGGAHSATAAEPVALPPITITAFDIGFKEADITAPAGDIRIDYRNEGALVHTLVFDGAAANFKLEAAAAGGSDAGTAKLDPGTYAYYCDIIGHRSAGMEGKLTLIPAEESDGASGSASTADIVAEDLAFRPNEVTVPPGPLTVNLRNEGAIPHNLLFDDVPGFAKLDVATTGATASGTVDLKPGTYTFYCDQAGHRAAGMEGKLNVKPGAAGGPAAGGDQKAGTGGPLTEIVAQDIAFEPAEISVPRGPIEIMLRNEGAIPHTFLFDEVPAFTKLEVLAKGATATGTLDVGPGTYTFYCDQPGHRAAGMEGTMTVG